MIVLLRVILERFLCSLAARPGEIETMGEEMLAAICRSMDSRWCSWRWIQDRIMIRISIKKVD